MIEELVAAYGYFKADDRIKAVVVTGAGKGFCVGADLQIGFGILMQELKENPSKMMDEYRDGYVCFIHCMGLVELKQRLFTEEDVSRWRCTTVTSLLSWQSTVPRPGSGSQ